MIHSLRAVRLAQEERVRCTITDSHSKRDAESAATDVARGLRGLIKEVYSIDALPAHFVMNLAYDLDGVWVEGRWEPHTEAISILGGPEDGALYDHPGAPKRELHTLAMDEPPRGFTVEASEKATAEVATRTVIYQCTGWSDTQHAWAYSPT